MKRLTDFRKQYLVTEVAERVGYESEYTFSRAFKRATGFSPGEYRKSAIYNENKLRHR